MAITYNTFFNELSTTYNIETGKSFMNLSTPMKRNIPYPVDRYSVFSSFDELSAYYTNNPVVYPGQVVTVVNDNNTVDLYTLDYENNNIFEVTADTGAITSAQTIIPKRIDSLTTIDNIETDLSSLTYKPSYLYTNNTQEIYVPIPDSDYSQVSSWISLTSQKFYSLDKSANLIIDSNYGRAKLTAKTGQEWFTIDTGIEFTSRKKDIQGIKQVYYAKEGCYYICTSDGLYKTYNSDLSNCEKVEENRLCVDQNDPINTSCIFTIIEIGMQEYLLTILRTGYGTHLFYYNSYTNEVKKLENTQINSGWISEYLLLSNTSDYTEILFASGSNYLFYYKFNKLTKTVNRKTLSKIYYNNTTTSVRVIQHVVRYKDYIYASSHFAGETPPTINDKFIGLIRLHIDDLYSVINNDNNVSAEVLEEFLDTAVYNIRPLDILTIDKQTNTIHTTNTLFIACDNSYACKKHNVESLESANGIYKIHEVADASTTFLSLSSELPFNKAKDIYKTDYIDKDENGILTIDTNWYFIGYDDVTLGYDDNIPPNDNTNITGYIIYSANITNETNSDGMWEKSDIVNSGNTIGNENYPELTEIKGYITVNSKINTSSITYISPAPASPYLANLSDIPVLGVKVNNKVQEIDENGFVKITRTNVTHSYAYTDVSSTCPSNTEPSSVSAVGEKIALNTYNNIEEYDVLRLKSITLYCPGNITETETAQLKLNLYNSVINNNGTLTGGKLIAKSANVVEYASNNEMTFVFDNDIIELSRNSIYTITLFDANTNNVKQVSLVSYTNPNTSNGNLIITNTTGTANLIDISYNSFDTNKVLHHKLNFIVANYNNAEIFVEKTQVATIKDLETLKTTLSTNIENLETTFSTDVENLETTFNTNIENLETALNTDIENLETALNTDIENLETALNTDIENLGISYASDNTIVNLSSPTGNESVGSGVYGSIFNMLTYYTDSLAGRFKLTNIIVNNPNDTASGFAGEGVIARLYEYDSNNRYTYICDSTNVCNNSSASTVANMNFTFNNIVLERDKTYAIGFFKEIENTETSEITYEQTACRVKLYMSSNTADGNACIIQMSQAEDINTNELNDDIIIDDKNSNAPVKLTLICNELESVYVKDTQVSLDSNAVHKTFNETIAGVKTFVNDAHVNYVNFVNSGNKKYISLGTDAGNNKILNITNWNADQQINIEANRGDITLSTNRLNNAANAYPDGNIILKTGSGLARYDNDITTNNNLSANTIITKKYVDNVSAELQNNITNAITFKSWTRKTT